MQDTHDMSQLREHKASLLEQLQGIGDFRQGTLVERFRKCGKSYCHCAKAGDPGHGPSWSLTRKIDGKTVTRIIPTAAVATIKEQLAEYHHFRETVSELIETNVLICDAVLERTAEESDPKGAEKGGSRE